MISARQFIAILEQKDLLPATVIASLRQQLDESPTPISAALVAKRLVDTGLLSRLLAQRLMDQAENLPERPIGPAHSDLGLIDDVDEQALPGRAGKGSKSPPPVVPADEIEEVDEVPLVVPPGEVEEIGLAEEEPEPKRPSSAAPSQPALRQEPASPPMPARRPQPEAPRGTQPQIPSASHPEVRKPAEPGPKEESSAPSGAKPPASPAGGPSKTPAKQAAPKRTSAPAPERAAKRTPDVARSRVEEGAPQPLAGAPTRPSRADVPSPAAASDIAPSPLAFGPLDELMGLEGDAGHPVLMPRTRRRRWKSPLVLICGGLLLVLVVLGLVVLWSVVRGSGDEMFEAAQADYRASSYNEAIVKYTQYLEEFPDHPSAGTARVNRGLARLRQAMAGATDWSRVLDVAKGVLEELSREPESGIARPELAVLLPAIAQGLAHQAQQAGNAAPLVAQTKEALVLVDRYVPGWTQQGGGLAHVEASLPTASQDPARDGELAKAVTAITKAAAEGKIAGAYKIRAALIQQYPMLVDDFSLADAMASVSRAEALLVKMVGEAKAGVKSEPPDPILATVVPVRRTTDNSVPDAQGQVAAVFGEGAVYGLDAASGKLLWRRAMGAGAGAPTLAFPPNPLRLPDGDLLLVDAARHHVLRLDAATGQLRWRHAVGEPLDAHPVLVDQRVAVATRSGRLVLIDVASGDSPGYVQFPQPLRVAPAVDVKQSLAYQIGEHSNLYVVDLAKGACKEVIYLGHEPGSTTAPPVLVSRLLLVPLADGAGQSVVRVHDLAQPKKAEAEPQTSKAPPQAIRMKGHVRTAPSVGDSRVLIATDAGEIRVLEARPADTSAPVADVAQRAATGEDRAVRFPLLLGGELWIGDSQLTAYELHAPGDPLVPKWAANEQGVTLQALAQAGRAVLQVRRRAGLAGIAVSAVSADEGRIVWETHLGAPPAVEPRVDPESGRITHLTSIGAVFQLDAESLQDHTTIDPPVAALPPTSVKGPVNCVVPLPNGMLAMAAVGSGVKAVYVFHPAAKKESLQILPLSDPLGGRIAPFRDGILVPTSAGQMLLLDPRSGRNAMEPFQPGLGDGAPCEWREPGTAEQNQVVLSDGRNRLYRVGVTDHLRPRLAASVEVSTPRPIVSPVATLDKFAFVVDADGTLLAFALADLAVAEKWPLVGVSLWGPRRVGKRVMLATESHLCCVDATPKLLWKMPLPAGPLAGAPLEHGDAYLLAAAKGLVWRADAATGKELGRIDVGQPLATGPVVSGEHLLIGARDGSLCQIKQP